jgi:hypothetical protein
MTSYSSHLYVSMHFRLRCIRSCEGCCFGLALVVAAIHSSRFRSGQVRTQLSAVSNEVCSTLHL